MLKRVYLEICVCSPYLLLIEVEADLRLLRLGEDFIPAAEDQKTAIILTQADRPLPVSPSQTPAKSQSPGVDNCLLLLDSSFMKIRSSFIPLFCRF